MYFVTVEYICTVVGKFILVQTVPSLNEQWHNDVNAEMIYKNN